MAEAPYQRDWRPIGARHGLRITHVTGPPDPGDWDDADPPPLATTFTVVRDDGALVLRHLVPYPLAPDWVHALIGVLDVPADELPAATTWGRRADELAAHRRELAGLPGDAPAD